MNKEYYCSPTKKGGEWHEAVILTVDEVRIYPKEDKQKTTFTANFDGKDNPVTVVSWTNLRLHPGDEVNICGWQKDNIFLSGKLMRTKCGNDGS